MYNVRRSSSSPLVLLGNELIISRQSCCFTLVDQVEPKVFQVAMDHAAAFRPNFERGVHLCVYLLEVTSRRIEQNCTHSDYSDTNRDKTIAETTVQHAICRGTQRCPSRQSQLIEAWRRHCHRVQLYRATCFLVTDSLIGWRLIGWAVRWRCSQEPWLQHNNCM